MKRALPVLIAVILMACAQEELVYVRVKYYEPIPLAFYNSFMRQGVPSVTFYLRNPGRNQIVVRITSEYMGYSHKAVTTLTLNPGEMRVVNQTIPLIFSKAKNISEETEIPLHYKVDVLENGKWVTECEQTVMVKVYPMNVMVWALREDGRLIGLQDYIAVFVTPNSKCIKELIAKARKYAPHHYLPGAKGSSLPQVEAIFDALRFDYNLSYVNSPYLYGSDLTQVVRLPSESLKLGSINCLDGSVLLASALEALGFRTYIAILPNHALVAWVDQKNKTLYGLETTMINSSFTLALNKGLEELNKYWKNLTDDNPWNGYLVDIQACRRAGIIPVPIN